MRKVFTSLCMVICSLLISGCRETLLEYIFKDKITEIPPIYMTDIPDSEDIATESGSISEQNEDQADDMDTICSFMWTSRLLPDITDKAQINLNQAGLTNIHVQVEVYGENCLDSTHNEIKYFKASRTDFHISMEVIALSDDVLGNVTFQILKVLTELDDGTLPGEMQGNVGIHYSKGEYSKYLWFSYTTGKEAYEKGFRGQYLIDYLQ